MSLFNNKCYKCGKCGENPDKLVIFVHGYNGSPEAIHYAIQWLSEKLENAVIVVPRAPYTCEKNAENLRILQLRQLKSLIFLIGSEMIFLKRRLR